MSGDSVILGGDFDYEQPFYQPPIMVQSALSVGLNKHITLKGNSVTEENSRRQAAQKRAKQDAYRAMLDADRVASIPVSRRPAQFPSPQVEATGFMIGRQEEVSPERKKEMQAQWKQELAQYAALPSIQAERRPFPHRAYTPAMSSEQRNSIDGLEDAALAELLAKRAEVRRRLTQDRSDVIHQLSPNDSSPLKLSFRQPPVGGKALDSASKKVFTISPGLEPTTGLAIGPDIKQEKLNSLQKNASFMVNVRRDLELKASQKAAEDERNLAILYAGRQGQGQGQGQLTGMVRSPSKLAEQFVDYEGNTTILIGGETMDMARSRTAAEKKRQQQVLWRQTLEAQVQEKSLFDARSQRGYSLIKESRGGAGTSLAGFGPTESSWGVGTRAGAGTEAASGGASGGASRGKSVGFASTEFIDVGGEGSEFKYDW